MKEHGIEKVWIHKGFKCAVIFVRSHRCGYVRIPKENPAFDLPYDDVPIDIHGGLTFGSSELNGFKATDNKYWFGFDCAHLGDKTKGSIFKEDGHFWTLDEVIKEANKLAERLSKITWRDIIEYRMDSMPDWFKKRVMIKKINFIQVK